MRTAAVLLALAFGLAAGPASADLKQRDGALCRDLIVIGTIKSYDGFVGYDELDPDPDPNAIYLGGRYDLTIKVDEVVEGERLPPTITVRALMGSQYRQPVQMLFYLQKEGRGSYWAADWQVVKRDAGAPIQIPDAAPKRCKD